ncbi:AAA family ATPase, partial [Candidatus Bipolaricaulota bacterium]|nr:AAA family ATPase [Candidatus Bipolaricaulota bacterium]
SQGETEEEGEDFEINPSLILAIEEVELYQHPSRQRHLESILSELSQDPPPGLSSMQILYSTHSPLFIDVKRFGHVSLFRKILKDSEKPKVTSVSTSSLEEIVREKEKIEDVNKGTYDVEPERARLKTLMTPWTNEGFFSDVVVLVEGIEDRSAVIASASQKDINFEERNISVIPVNGKNNLLKAILMFQGFGIDTYALWDSDKNQGEDGKPEENRKLLKAFNHQEEDFPELSTENFTCFQNNLTRYIKTNLGENFYRENLNELREKYGFVSDNHAKKNVEVVSELISIALEAGKDVELLNGAVEKIIRLSEG